MQAFDQAVAVMAEVAPGCQDHINFTVGVMARCQEKYGLNSKREILAQQRVKVALVARYGSQFMDDPEAVAKVVRAVAGRFGAGEPDCGRVLIA